MAKKASEKALSDLHGELAKHMTTLLKEGEEIIEEETPDGELVKRKIVKPATLNVIRQFLKDNEITADLKPGSPLGGLVDELPSYDDDE